MEINEIKRIFPFKSDYEVYILIAIARKKYNENIKSTEVVFRDIIKSEEEFERKIIKMKTLIDNYSYGLVKPQDFNLYITINPRDVRKAYCLLKKRFADWDFEGNLLPHIKKIHGEWFSCLQKPEAKARKQYFLIDFDIYDEIIIQSILEEVKKITEIVKINKTRNGMHVLIKPCDYKKLNEIVNPYKDENKIEIFRDGLFFLCKGGEKWLK